MPRTRFLSFFALLLLLTGLFAAGAAPSRAISSAGAARLTPRNFVPSLDAHGLLTVAFDLANTGTAPATSTQITSVKLLNTAGGPLGTRRSPAALPAGLNDIAAGAAIHLSVTFTGVSAGQRGKLSLAFAASGGISASTGFPLTVPAGPTAAPLTLTGTHGDGVIQLAYTPPAGVVTYYNVQRATVSGGPYTTISTPGAVTGTTYTDTNVVNGTLYFYVVTAVSANGESLPSNEAAVLAGFIGTGLAAAPGDGQITLTYDPIIGAVNYQMFYSTDGTNFYGLGYTGNVTTFTQTGLANDHTYYYYVVPYNNAGAGSQSGTISALVSLPAPTGISVTPGNGLATVSWTASTFPYATNYQVFYSTDNVNFYGLGYTGNVTTFTQTGLANAATYYYYVVPYNNGGAGAPSVTVHTTISLPAPTNITATPGDGAVTVTWASSGFPFATNYQVFYSSDGVNFYGLGYTGNVNTFTQTGLANTQAYTYYVVAYNDGGASPNSLKASATVSLAAPTGVAAAAGDSSVAVTWNAVPTATNYQVFYSTDNVNFYGLGYAGNVTTFTQGGLSNATTYYYYVVAYNKGGNSPNSAKASATVTLAAPTGVAAAPGDGSATITWNAVPTATNYQVFYSADGVNFYGLGYTNNATTFTQTGLTNGTTYTYYVVAYNGGGAGPNSAKVSTLISLPAPTGVTATPGSGSVTVHWTASAFPGATNYQVFYSADGANFYGQGYTGNVTTFTQGGLTGGTKYYYYVVPYNGGGTGTTSATVSATAL